MSANGLRAAFTPGSPIVLDSSAVLAYLNGTDAVAPAATIVINELVASGANAAVVSALLVTETLVRPFRAGTAGTAAVGTVETFLRHFPNLRIRDVDHDIAREAARVRALTGLKTPDAIVLATALTERIDIVVTNDDRWQTAIGRLGATLTLVHLDAHLPL